MVNLQLDVIVTRGSHVESQHRVHAAVVSASGDIMCAARDTELVTHWRSCAKPFQIMPLLESGGFDKLGWGDDQLALSCASHGGEPEHVKIADGMLTNLGLEEGDLACGPHEPLSARGARILRESGARATRLHNNCSGKHSAMLARAITQGWPTVEYERQHHPVQQSCLATVARWTGLDEGDIGMDVDGCGCTVFALPLSAMAHAYAALAHGTRTAQEIPSRIVHAMRTRPFLVGGSDRFDTAIMEITEGRVIAKVGAEGVHSLALIDAGVGIAVKVEDGAQRAQFPAVISILQYLGALTRDLPDRLTDLLHRQLRNTRGEIVGEVRPLLES